jgi:hypothetical protein
MLLMWERTWPFPYADMRLHPIFNPISPGFQAWMDMNDYPTFDASQISTITKAVSLAEELVIDYYKLSLSHWLKKKYDIKTLADLGPDEIACGAFAQVLHYEGRPRNSSLESASYDFYKICLQDHRILSVLDEHPQIELFPFGLYIMVHELIHVVRFSKFIKNFYASTEEKNVEEMRVHEETREILKNLKIAGMKPVLNFYRRRLLPIENLQRG